MAELENMADVEKGHQIKRKVSDIEYFMTPVGYYVNEELIEKISNSVITKIRVEHDFGYFDRNVMYAIKPLGSKFSKAVKWCNKQIQNALESNNSIYDNF